MIRKFIPVEEAAKEWMNHPEFRAAYDALEDEFALVAALIEARAKADMTQEQVAAAMGTTQAVVARLEGGAAAGPRHARWSGSPRRPAPSCGSASNRRSRGGGRGGEQIGLMCAWQRLCAPYVRLAAGCESTSSMPLSAHHAFSASSVARFSNSYHRSSMPCASSKSLTRR